MTEVIERIARVIASKLVTDWDFVERGGRSVEEVVEADWPEWKDAAMAAMAAIEAIREPAESRIFASSGDDIQCSPADIDVATVRGITISCEDGNRVIALNVPTIRHKDLCRIVEAALAGSPNDARGISLYGMVAVGAT